MQLQLFLIICAVLGEMRTTEKHNGLTGKTNRPTFYRNGLPFVHLLARPLALGTCAVRCGEQPTQDVPRGTQHLI